VIYCRVAQFSEEKKVLTVLRIFVNSDELTLLASTGIGTETSQFRKLALGSFANSR
jgi:hypothetical protein